MSLSPIVLEYTPGVKLWPVALCALILTGCQAQRTLAEPPPIPAETSTQVLGLYRLKVSPDEVAEAGGLDKLPALVIEKDHWRMINTGGDDSSGTWVYNDGKLTLTDKTGEQTVFLSDEKGLELVEQSDNPVRFAKYGAQEPEGKKAATATSANR